MHTALKAHESQQFLKKGDSFYCHVITVQVMAVADVSTAHQYPVGAVLQRT
jgi:hypothetical protein